MLDLDVDFEFVFVYLFRTLGRLEEWYTIKLQTALPLCSFERDQSHYLKLIEHQVLVDRK